MSATEAVAVYFAGSSPASLPAWPRMSHRTTVWSDDSALGRAREHVRRRREPVGHQHRRTLARHLVADAGPHHVRARPRRTTPGNRRLPPTTDQGERDARRSLAIGVRPRPTARPGRSSSAGTQARSQSSKRSGFAAVGQQEAHPQVTVVVAHRREHLGTAVGERDHAPPTVGRLVHRGRRRERPVSEARRERVLLTAHAVVVARAFVCSPA